LFRSAFALDNLSNRSRFINRGLTLSALIEKLAGKTSVNQTASQRQSFRRAFFFSQTTTFVLAS